MYHCITPGYESISHFATNGILRMSYDLIPFDISRYVIVQIKMQYLADMGRLQGPCNRLRLRLLDNIMITITIMITIFIHVIDYDYDYIVK